MTTTIISSNYQKFTMAVEMFNETTLKMKKQIKQQKYGFEYYTRYFEKTYFIRALYLQATIGDAANDYSYDGEESFMWNWIHGNEISNAWKKLEKMDKLEAEELFIKEWYKLKDMLPNYMEYWKLLNNPQISEEELKAKKIELSIPEDDDKLPFEEENNFQDIEWIIEESVESSEEEENNI